MVEIVQNAGGYVFGRKRAESAPPAREEKETPKPEIAVPKEKKTVKKKAEPKAEKKITVHVIKKEKKEKPAKEESDEESKKKA